MFRQPSLFIINPTNSKFPQNFKKITRVAELNEEFNRLAKEKNAEYTQYRTTRERMRDLANARRNAEMILKEQGENVESKGRKQIK